MKTEMKVKERPILFSGPMVRAILEGRKTQTRRPIKFNTNREGLIQTEFSSEGFLQFRFDHYYESGTMVSDTFPCPFGQPGDRLWVRETWAFDPCLVCDEGRDDIPDGCTCAENPKYKASWPEYLPPYWGKWKPSIHMPRWASRITLEITNVRVEKIAEIAFPYSVKAEGFKHTYDFKESWDSIYAKKGYGWDANPWVWVVEFRVAVKP